MKNIITNTRGFTLIELLVVISIIGLLSSVVLASLDSAREKARNTQTVTMVNNYITGSELYFNSNKGYPYPGNTTTYYCLGDHATNKCWTNGTGYNENATLITEFKKVMAGVPGNENYVKSGTARYNGIIYRCLVYTGGKCKDIYLLYYLAGPNQDCGRGSMVNSTSERTYCKFDSRVYK